MDENFKKFAKKVWIEILIKCAVAGLAAGLFAVNAVLLPCKLFGIDILWVYYVLIALGGFVLGGGVAFLFLHTNDKKIAKRIDRDLALQERVQTAYEFSNQSSDMLDMQRSNASAELLKLPARVLPFKNIIATTICGVIAVSGLVAAPVISFTVPAVYAQTDDGGDNGSENTLPPEVISDWEWASLDKLIEEVRASERPDADTKTAILNSLYGLRADLVRTSGKTLSKTQRENFVYGATNQMRNDVLKINDVYGGDLEDPRVIANNEEVSYVINRLLEIFGLARTDDDDGSGGGKKDDDEEDPGNSEGNKGSGKLEINGMPFFDPEQGYVTCGEIRQQYYDKVQQALAEGIISQEEWEDIIIAYFADLGNKEENN